MVKGLRGGCMVCGFLQEDLGELGIFSQESFRLSCLSLHGKVSRHGQLVDHCHSLGVGEL